MNTCMRDSCICWYIMREHPEAVLQGFDSEVKRKNQIVISAITYAEMRYGQIGKKASPKHKKLVDAFVARLDNILPWDKAAIDSTIDVKLQLVALGSPIGNNDTAIAGHAIASGCVLVTNNLREFSRVPELHCENWVG